MESWKKKTLAIGIFAGIAAGVVASLIYIQKIEEQEEAKPRLTASSGVKVGLGVLGVLRLISDLGSGRE